MRGVGGEQPGRALGHEVEQPGGVELGGELALDLGQRGGLTPPRPLEREQPRILQRQRRLVGESLQQLRFLVGEAPAATRRTMPRAPMIMPLTRRGTARRPLRPIAQRLPQVLGQGRASGSARMSGDHNGRPSATARPRMPVPGGSHVAGVEAARL